jgi:choline/glycine/proline betaine transport protein
LGDLLDGRIVPRLFRVSQRPAIHIATSLGLGAAQMNGGLKYLLGVEVSATNQVILIICVSAVATLSAVSGIRRGIRRLSELNIWLSLVLVGFVILAGPSAVILGTFFSGSVDYLATFLPMGIWVDPDTSSHWQGTWTIFYWGWWISSACSWRRSLAAGPFASI